MIEKQLTLPYLEDWTDTDDGASVRLPIAIIELVPGRDVGRCIVVNPASSKRSARGEKSAIGDQPDPAQSDPFTSVLLTCEATK